MKKLYIYSTIAIIIIITMSVLKGYSEEGFQSTTILSRINTWFRSEYFIIPLIMTIIIGPIIYFIYTRILRSINKSLTAVPTNSSTSSDA